MRTHKGYDPENTLQQMRLARTKGHPLVANAEKLLRQVAR
jgi:hypothetical protein